MTLEELRAMRTQMKTEVEKRNTEGKTTQIIVGMGTCGIASGAKETFNAFLKLACSFRNGQPQLFDNGEGRSLLQNARVCSDQWNPFRIHIVSIKLTQVMQAHTRAFQSLDQRVVVTLKKSTQSNRGFDFARVGDETCQQQLLISSG